MGGNNGSGYRTIEHQVVDALNCTLPPYLSELCLVTEIKQASNFAATTVKCFESDQDSLAIVNHLMFSHQLLVITNNELPPFHVPSAWMVQDMIKGRLTLSLLIFTLSLSSLISPYLSLWSVCFSKVANI